MPEALLDELEPEFDSEPAADESPGTGKKKWLILLLVTFLLLGGGSGGGYYWWRVKAHAKQAAREKIGNADNADDGEVKQVIELQPFIVNLADRNEARYLRMTVSLGIAESGDDKPDPLFTTKVRNAILGIVTTKTSEEILTVEGKAVLRKEMLEAARRVVNKPEVHAIYITDFIIQM